jgi:NfeD-like C-terminal, partner-binding
LAAMTFRTVAGRRSPGISQGGVGSRPARGAPAPPGCPSRPAQRVAALVGRSALVIEPVDAHHGRVRIGGEVWSARALSPGQVIPAGAVVDVFEIDGAPALVYAEERS